MNAVFQADNFVLNKYIINMMACLHGSSKWGFQRPNSTADNNNLSLPAVVAE